MITFALEMRGGYSSCVIIFSVRASGDGWKVGNRECWRSIRMSFCEFDVWWIQ